MFITIVTLIIITMLVFAPIALGAAFILNSVYGQIEEQTNDNNARLLTLIE